MKIPNPLYIKYKGISKRKIMLRFFQWKFRRDKGAQWWGFALSFINIERVVLIYGMVRLLIATVKGITLWDILGFGGLIVLGIVMEFVKWKVGDYDIKRGLFF